jgi:DNA-binding transcriptional ArsR family regulator
MLKSEDALNHVFKCLGDPGRRAMLVHLSSGEATLGQLAAPLAMSLPAVHQHLALLEKAGLVTCEKRGRQRWCRMEAAGLRSAEEWIKDRSRLWEQRLEALGEFLAAEPDGTSSTRGKTQPRTTNRSPK